MPRNPAKPALAGPWLRPPRLSQSLPTKDSGLTLGRDKPSVPENPFGISEQEPKPDRRHHDQGGR
jgi:hypothetical protein